VKRFRSRRRGGAYAQFDQHEARLIANMAAQVAELVRDGSPTSVGSADPLEALVGIDGSAEAPEDPVLKRLLPDAYRDAEDDAAEFRRFTEHGLREGKVRNAQAVIASLTAGGMAEDDLAAVSAPDVEIDVDLDAEGVQSWLRCLTDIRLSLATRLGITEDDQERWDALADDDPAVMMHDIYDWLGFVQETLVLAVS